MNNICQFVPPKSHPDPIRTIHFVFETAVNDSGKLNVRATHTLHLVTGGKGILHLAFRSFPLEAGDLFLAFPGVPFRIENTESLHFLYISFIGTRAVQILDELRIRSDSPVLHDYGFLEESWRHALEITTPRNADLTSESVLLGTFAEISKRNSEPGEPHTSEAATRMQQYIDEHFSEPDLTMEKVCRVFSYHPKYGSTLFKQHLRVGFREYLRTLRVQYACALIEQGMTSVKDLAALCGYPDPSYFSRVFHQETGISPKMWYENRRKSITEE